jgi:hypothetical protein
MQGQQSNPVEDILNTPETVRAFGREYKIKRFALGPLTRAAEHLAPLGYLFRSAMATAHDNTQIGPGNRWPACSWSHLFRYRGTHRMAGRQRPR